MESFHEVMGKTFHSAEKGNMEPVKTRSAELVSRAIAWKNSTPPAGYNKKAIKKSLRKLIKQAKEVDKAVKKSASDKDITEKLNALHDTFHEIMEECED
ncbi:MAG: hypothetical protein N2747_00030 [Chitinophagaceae bacterium]|nr:hypothetical protein [Chitinophagaceae bacterium]